MAAEHAQDTTRLDLTVPTVEALIALRADVAKAKPARRAQTRHAGPNASNIRGRGMEYAESRAYVPGDDARHIDWRLTARTGRAHTKLFQAETERLTVVVADTSASLFFGSRQRFKSVQAARIAAGVIWRAVLDGDRVGLVVPGHAAAPRRFGTGMRGALPLMHALVEAYAQPGAPDTGVWTKQLAGLRNVLRHGARMVVIADVHTVASVPAERWLMFHGVEVHVVLVVDAFEQLPPAKTLPVKLSAKRALLPLESTAAADRWQDHFSAPVAAFQASAQGLGVHVHVVRTDDDATAWLQYFNAPQAHVA